METNQEGKSEKFFKDFGKKMDQFLRELRETGDRAEVELKQKFEELKKAAETLKKEAGSKERWKEVEDGLKKAGQELETAFKAAFKKKDKA
jgi:hypothetical protein